MDFESAVDGSLLWPVATWLMRYTGSYRQKRAKQHAQSLQYGS